MAIIDLFSKRQEKFKNQSGVNYCYDQLPFQFRQQIWDIIVDTFPESLHEICLSVNKMLCHEYGRNQLCNIGGVYTRIEVFIVQNYNVNEVLDTIELFFNDHLFKDIEGYEKDAPKLKEAIKELNERFNEHNIGYQFQANQIIRQDSMYMHKEVVEPTLALINNIMFAGACDEYLKAQKNYRTGSYKDCLSECLKAFESTMKIIFEKKGWNYDKEKDTVSKLINICFEKKLIPEYMQQHYISLRSLLEHGVPRTRNRNSGHGQGSVIKVVSDSLARYTLNLTGSNIIFLIEQSEL